MYLSDLIQKWRDATGVKVIPKVGSSYPAVDDTLVEFLRMYDDQIRLEISGTDLRSDVKRIQRTLK